MGHKPGILIQVSAEILALYLAPRNSLASHALPYLEQYHLVTVGLKTWAGADVPPEHPREVPEWPGAKGTRGEGTLDCEHWLRQPGPLGTECGSRKMR